MAKFEPTAAQRLAIESRGGSLLVSAAAGSGKTRVLTERLAAYVSDPRQPRDVDSFLVITYTRAAAAELRGRILAALSALAAEHPEDAHLRRQSTLCYRAHIETIHSFCTSLLREHCHTLGLAPDFRVAEESRSGQLREAVLERCLDAWYETAAENAPFRALADTVGAGRDDSRLAQLVLQLHTQLRSHPEPEAWAAAQKEALAAPGATDLGDTPWGRELLGSAVETVRYWAEVMTREAETLAQGEEKLAKAYLGSFTETAEALRDLDRALQQGWDAALARLPIPFPRLGAIRGEKPPAALYAQEKREKCKKAVAGLMKRFSAPSAVLLREIRDTAPAMGALLDLVLDFDRRYAREKRRQNLVDFADLEHFALKLLWDGEKQAPSPIAEAVSRRFTEILVDEYQDVNAVQERIFHCLSREGRNLFLVGDVKQSIYRFRLADPGIFLKKYQEAVPLDAPPDPAAAPALGRVLLRENFRSRKEVLDCCNQVFSALMSPRLGELAYDDEAALRPGAQYPPLPEGEALPRLELVPAAGAEDEDGAQRPDQTAREAACVARRIRALVDSGAAVTEGGALRPVRYEDICVLLRAPGSSGEIYRQALAEAGVPVAAELGESFFASLEVTVVLSFLAVLDNPHQDVPLISVLRSPFFSFSPDRLSAIRSGCREGDFYTALLAARETDGASAAFLDLVDRLRELAADLTAAELVQKLYVEAELPARCAAMPQGEARMENLQALFRLAVEFEDTGLQGLHAFSAWLRRRRDRGDAPQASAAGGVKVMSIHRSKGLEFPVVFLADTARRFHLADTRQAVLLHPELGLGPKYVDPARRLEYPTAARRAVAERLRREALSEELRVLYVAMTRAKERLFLTCSVKDPEALLQKDGDTDPPQAEELLACRSLGDWLLRAARLPGAAMVCSVWEEPVSPGARPGPEAAEAVPDAGAAVDTAALDWRYPHREAESLPSKLTATELGHAQHQPDPEGRPLLSPGRRSFRMPELRDTPRRLTPTERGTAAHLALQHLRLEHTGSREAIAGEIARLEALGLLTPEQAAAVDPGQLLRFFRSPLGRRILGAERLWREQRFSLLTDAARWYPGAEGEEILLQGVVDCCFLEGGALTILDYKTDAVTSDTWKERAERYRVQLETYAYAMERVLGYPVRQCILYFLQGGFSAVFDENFQL